MEDGAILKKLTSPDLYDIAKNFHRNIDNHHRYASFDFCYASFHPKTRKTEDLEKLCLQLGFYLASWGMLRGSSFLLQKSCRHYLPFVEFAIQLDESYWNDDVDNYNFESVERVYELYRKTSELIIPGKQKAETLISKILLGVFGNAPAFDQYFTKVMREIFKGDSAFRTFSPKNLLLLKDFYLANKEVIDLLSNNQKLTAFDGKFESRITYPKIKIIDAYGFYKGLKPLT